MSNDTETKQLAAELLSQLKERPVGDAALRELEACGSANDLVRVGLRIIAERNRKDLVFAWRAVCISEAVVKDTLQKRIEIAKAEGIPLDLTGIAGREIVLETTIAGFKWFGIFCPKSKQLSVLLEFGRDPNELDAEAVAAFVEIDSWIQSYGEPDEADKTLARTNVDEPAEPPEQFITKPMSQAKAALIYFANVDYSRDHKERLFREMVQSREIWSRQLNPPKGRLHQFDVRVVPSQKTQQTSGISGK